MNRSIKMISRIILFVCGLALVAVLFVPIWRIDLVAPQYPEGLFLLIYADKLGGNVDIINGLNHYIGMKTLHAEDFTEFRVLPYLVGFFALLFFVAGAVGRRKLVNTVFILFLIFGVVAMADFWKWEYDYGHNLDPNAAIQVPGMSYQPPLIGYKQLLNFSAYSMPATGGWLFVGAGALALLAVVIEWRARKIKLSTLQKPAAAAFLGIFLFSCNTEPEPIKTGIDHCTFCKMTITDNRFGAEVVTKRGKVYKFDDSHCVFSFLKTTGREDVSSVYFVDFAGDHSLVNAANAFFLRDIVLRSPMGGNLAAFETKEALQQHAPQLKGTIAGWAELEQK